MSLRLIDFWIVSTMKEGLGAVAFLEAVSASCDLSCLFEKDLAFCT